MTSPKVGTVWRQKSSPSNLYVLYDITNCLEGNDDYEKTACYADHMGNHFSRSVADWNNSYEEVTDYFNYPESEFLQGQAVHVYHQIDELCRRFRVVRMSAADRRKEEKPS